MPFSIRGTEYYRVQVADRPEEAYELLNGLAELGVNLLAFTAIPVGPHHVQLTIFPEDTGRLETEAKRAGLSIEGPHRAILVQGDDELGALARVHRALADASVAIYSSGGVTDGSGSFGYLIYVREDDYDRAMEALRVRS